MAGQCHACGSGGRYHNDLVGDLDHYPELTRQRRADRLNPLHHNNFSTAAGRRGPHPVTLNGGPPGGAHQGESTSPGGRGVEHLDPQVRHRNRLVVDEGDLVIYPGHRNGGEV